MRKTILITIAVIALTGLAILGWLTGHPLPTNPIKPTPTPGFTTIQNKPPRQQELIHLAEQGFEIDYDPNYEMYIVSILLPDFARIRTLAEQELIKRLNITQDQACQLNVSISSPQYVNPEMTQTYDTFSFCTN